MGRIEDSWLRIVEAVPCPSCGAIVGAPCINHYGMVFDGKGHYERREAYYKLRKRIREGKLRG